MPTLAPTTPVPRTDDYWVVVERTVDLLGGQPYASTALRREVETTPADEQALFYHAEPLDVAADLVGRAPDPAEIDAYGRLCTRLGWT